MRGTRKTGCRAQGRSVGIRGHRQASATRTGEAILAAISSEAQEAQRLEIERGRLWDQAIERYDVGERGVEARGAISQLVENLDGERCER